MIDLHSHILPGVDDGPADESEALDLAKLLHSEGVRKVVATPHQLGMFEGNIDAEQIVRRCKELEDYLRSNDLELEIIPGAEVRLDERIPKMLDSGQIATIGNKGKYLMVELIPEVFIDIEPLIDSLASRGVKIILAHPERYKFFYKKFDILSKWMEKGVILQITASSLLGKGYMPQIAKPLAFEMMAKAFVSFIASDAHDINQRAPHIKEAFDFISSRAGEKYAINLFVDNPENILNGMEPVNI